MVSPEYLQFVRNNLQFASIALLYYDYALTWTREVKYFWFRKPTLSTVLYICCRYAMAANVIYVLAVSGLIDNCEVAYRLCSSLGMLGRVGILTVWGARTYAVFNRNRGILAFVVSLGIARFAFSMCHVPFVSCIKRPKTFLGIPSELLAVMTMVDELILALLTTGKIYYDIRNSGVDQSLFPKGLSLVIMQQGLLYLFLVSLLACGTISMYNLEGVMFEPLLNGFTIPVSGMMTCRFLIHLREWEESKSVHGDTTMDFSIEPIQFENPYPDRPRSWSRELRRDSLWSVGVISIAEPSEVPTGSDCV